MPRFNVEDEMIAVGMNANVSMEFLLAERFINSWALVAALDDGEDSGGRQKLRHMTPQECVDRAFETARLMVEKAEAGGHLREIPDSVERLAMANTYKGVQIVAVKRYSPSSAEKAETPDEHLKRGIRRSLGDD